MRRPRTRHVFNAGAYGMHLAKGGSRQTGDEIEIIGSTLMSEHQTHSCVFLDYLCTCVCTTENKTFQSLTVHSKVQKRAWYGLITTFYIKAGSTPHPGITVKELHSALCLPLPFFLSTQILSGWVLSLQISQKSHFFYGQENGRKLIRKKKI